VANRRVIGIRADKGRKTLQLPGTDYLRI